MPRVRVNLLGRTLVEVDGREAGLTPIAKAVLIRLVFAQGSAVFVNEIFHDVWAIAGPVHRANSVRGYGPICTYGAHTCGWRGM
jgi:hypothetical protein